MFTKLTEQLKANPKTIVFTEGTDPRIQDAAAKLTAEGILNVILLGNPDAVKLTAADAKYDISKCEIIDPARYADKDAMVEKMVELRKGKMTEEQVRDALSKGNYFGTMLVKMGKADCLLGGATYSTADTVRPALQLIKTKPGNNIVSSCFIMVKDDQKLAMGDCAINIAPNEDELVEIAVETAKLPRFSESILRLQCCPTPLTDPARAIWLLWLPMLPRKSRKLLRIWLLTASFSSTLLLHRKLLKLSVQALRLPDRRTHSSSLISMPATSAIRSLLVWADTKRSVLFCRV